MSLNIDELDGKYIVKSHTTKDGDLSVNGDGETEIRNGLTFRKDKNGFIWESGFTIIGDDLVQMESTIDPSHADKFITDEKGNPTKGMTNYKTNLNVSRGDKGQVILSGTIEHAGETTQLVMEKIS